MQLAHRGFQIAVDTSDHGIKNSQKWLCLVLFKMWHIFWFKRYLCQSLFEGKTVGKKRICSANCFRQRQLSSKRSKSWVSQSKGEILFSLTLVAGTVHYRIRLQPSWHQVSWGLDMRWKSYGIWFSLFSPGKVRRFCNKWQVPWKINEI